MSRKRIKIVTKSKEQMELYNPPMAKRPIVVCVKVANIRPKYDNLKEWSEDDKNVYIGRKGIVFIKNEDGSQERFPKKDSYYANPFKLNKNKDNLEEVLEEYREYAKEKFSNEDILKLGGKTIGCWCASGEVCHGGILAEMYD